VAWLRIDDRFRTHPKIQRAQLGGWLHFCGISYCREHLTDGLIPREAVGTLAPGLMTPYKHAARLVEVGLWHEEKDGFRVHDFLDWNPTRDEVEANREWGRQRKGLYRDKDVTAAVRERDQSLCRYCGALVNWTDRRSEFGGQFDHVIPRGPATLENVVVSCRGCNIRKNDRTPDEAVMPLLQVGTSSGREKTSSKRPVTSSPHASARIGAGDAGLGSLSGSDRWDLDLPEESPRETTPPVWVKPHETAGATPLPILDGLHRLHAWCCSRGVCVPIGLHSEFCGRLGTPDADVRLRAWYPAVVAQFEGRGIGDNLFRFWQHEFEGWVGTVTSRPADMKAGKGARMVEAFRTAGAKIGGGT